MIGQKFHKNIFENRSGEKPNVLENIFVIEIVFLELC